MAVHAGRLVLVKIDTSSAGVGAGGAGASWTTIGQQRGGSFSRTSETADATHKGDSGWPDAVVTRTPWSVSVDGALNPVDSAWTTLLTRWAAKGKVWVQVNANSITGEYIEGQALITDLSYEFPESDVVTFSAEFQGASALVTSTVYS